MSKVKVLSYGVNFRVCNSNFTFDFCFAFFAFLYGFNKTVFICFCLKNDHLCFGKSRVVNCRTPIYYAQIQQLIKLA